MGLLSKIFRKKDENKKNVNNEKIDSTELTEEELDKVYGHPNCDWCPKVNVEPIDIRARKNNGHIRQTQNNLER